VAWLVVALLGASAAHPPVTSTTDASTPASSAREALSDVLIPRRRRYLLEGGTARLATTVTDDVRIDRFSELDM
jgi:hypothetical protein